MTTAVREFEADLAVSDVSVVADGVVALTLAHPDGRTLPNWAPGAHIDLVLREDVTRQYSLCGRPTDLASWRVAVLLAPDSRGGSTLVHGLQAGATVTVRGPRNHFPLVGARRYLFIAGGIGITPMLPMIAEADATDAEWTLLYGGRSRESMSFLDELSGYGERVQVVPQDESGMLDLAAQLGTPTPGTLVYCCGPEGLLAAVESACATWPAGTLHLERFAPKTADGEVPADTAFEVHLQQTGTTLQVPADKTIFDVVREAGVSVLGSCLEGICGTCETEVLDGEIDHRDSVLDDDERAANDTMMICVSRCRSGQLTLDL